MLKDGPKEEPVVSRGKGAKGDTRERTHVKITKEMSWAMIPMRVMVDPSLARPSDAPIPPPEHWRKKVMQSEVTNSLESHDWRMSVWWPIPDSRVSRAKRM